MISTRCVTISRCWFSSVQTAAPLIALTKTSAAHLWSTSRNIRFDNSVTSESCWACNTADANGSEIMIKWLVPSSYQTQCTKAVPHAALRQVNTPHTTRVLSNWVQTPEHTRGQLVSVTEAASVILTQRSTIWKSVSGRNTLLWAGGLEASFNMTNHISSSHPLSRQQTDAKQAVRRPEDTSRKEN